MDQGTYNSYSGTPPVPTDALMTPNLYPHEAVHDPGIVAPNMLNDIGWGETYEVTGGGDAVSIVGAPYINPNWPCNCSEYLNGSPGTRITPGQTYPLYQSAYSSQQLNYTEAWSISLQATDGNFYMYDNNTTNITSGGGVAPINIPTPPTGYTWMRELDGSIRGQMSLVSTVSASTSATGQTETLTANVEIGLIAPPDIAQITTSQEECNSNVDLTFYAPGASNYMVQYGPSPGFYTNVYYVTGNNIYTATGLSVGYTYYFNVQGYNSGGTAQLAIDHPVTIAKTSCTNGVPKLINPVNIYLLTTNHLKLIAPNPTNLTDANGNIDNTNNPGSYAGKNVRLHITDIWGNTLLDNQKYLDPDLGALQDLSGLPVGTAISMVKDPVTNAVLNSQLILISEP